MAASQNTANVLKGADAEVQNAKVSGLLQESVGVGLTAFATGGQASATALPGQLNRFTTVATAADSAKLPVSDPGLTITVINDGAASLAVFGQTGDTINGLAANASVSIPAGGTLTFRCLVAGAWHVPLAAGAPKFTVTATAGPLVAAAGDLTGAGQVFAEYSGINASTLTTRTAALMIADAGLKVGQSYMVRVLNSNGAGTLTLTAGVGVTVTGKAAIALHTWVDYVVTVTGAATITFQSVGTGTQP